MMNLAKENDYTSGKWMIRVGWPEADAIWGMMVEALVGNKFPDELGILFIRVKGRKDPNLNPHTKYQGRRPDTTMICVQTKDGTDEEKTMRVAEIIRDLGIWEHCTYKLEVYTGLDIFRSNDYGLRPIIYKH